MNEKKLYKLASICFLIAGILFLFMGRNHNIFITLGIVFIVLGLTFTTFNKNTKN